LANDATKNRERRKEMTFQKPLVAVSITTAIVFFLAYMASPRVSLATSYSNISAFHGSNCVPNKNRTDGTWEYVEYDVDSNESDGMMSWESNRAVPFVCPVDTDFHYSNASGTYRFYQLNASEIDTVEVLVYDGNTGCGTDQNIEVRLCYTKFDAETYDISCGLMDDTCDEGETMVLEPGIPSSYKANTSLVFLTGKLSKCGAACPYLHGYYLGAGYSY
jgi:hypothetical protein